MLGIEWTAVAIVFAGFEVSIHVRSRGAYVGKRQILIGRILTHQAVALLLLAAGIATAAGTGGGIYWIVPASLGAVAVGMLDAWVLLVEILR